METIKANAAFLCNYEVMQILQQLKDSTQKKHKREGSLATVTYETVRYLQETECKNQSPQSIHKFLEAMKQFKLTKTEKLMMVNTPPRSELEIQLIVQESEERLSEEEMAPIKLWALDGSPPSWAVRMVADILGLQLEIKNIDFVNKEHKSPEILKLNPMGTIPIIQDGDFVISESHTIIKYLLEKYGSQHKERLYPSEIRARALADQAMFFDTGVVFIRVKIIALPAIYEGVDRLLPEVAKQVDDAYEVVNRYLERSAYVAAEHLTIADITMGASVLALDGLHPVDKRFPKVLDWLARLKKEPYFNKIAVPGAATLAKTVEYYWDMNKNK